MQAYVVLLTALLFVGAVALDVTMSSCNPLCDYSITLNDADIVNPSRFLFTLSPLDFALQTVIISDSANRKSVIQPTRQYGLYEVSLSGFVAPLSVRFSLPSTLPTAFAAVGVACFEGSNSSELLCRYLPSTSHANIPNYTTSVVKRPDGKYSLYFRFPYLVSFTDVLGQYKALVSINDVLSVDVNATMCQLATRWYGMQAIECYPLVSYAPNSMYPTLPYEAYIPLSTYSYARASAMDPQSLVNSYFKAYYPKPHQALLQHIAQFAQVTFDPVDMEKFKLSPRDPIVAPTEIPTLEKDRLFSDYMSLRSPDASWIANIAPTLPPFVRGFFATMMRSSTQSLDVSVDAETSNSQRTLSVDNLSSTHVSSSLPVDVVPQSYALERIRSSNLPVDVMTVIILVSGEQGFCKYDSLLLSLNMTLDASDQFVSEYASCVPQLPGNISCALKATVPRNPDGSSTIVVYSTAFSRAEALGVTITHIIPLKAALTVFPGVPIDTTSLAVDVTRLEPRLRVFNALGVSSKAKPPSYDATSGQYIASPYSDSSLSKSYSALTNVLDNQFISVEIGCLLEHTDIALNGNACTRTSKRTFKCPLTYTLSQALDNNPYSVNMSPFTWHRDVAYRVSPVVLKRMLTEDTTAMLETGKLDVHELQAFSFTVENPSATVNLENTTLVADLHTLTAPRLLYPSVDHFVFNLTLPLFEDAHVKSLSIDASFTPRVNVSVETSELDPTTAVPMTCYTVSAFAVACSLNAETAATRGQVNVTVPHMSPPVTPLTVPVSMSIYTGTDISMCGGYDPVEAAPAALLVTGGASVFASSASGAFVTADADIAAARRHLQQLAAEWRAGSKQQAQRFQATSAVGTVAVASALESLLPADWSLAHMSTAAAVPVTNPWNPATEGGASWALSTSVIWVWPVLGAMLLLIAAYRLHKWLNRKGAPTHPDKTVVTSVKVAENLYDAQTALETKQSTTQPASVQQPQPHAAHEISYSDTVIDIQYSASSESSESAEDLSEMEVESVEFDMTSLQTTHKVESSLAPMSSRSVETQFSQSSSLDFARAYSPSIPYTEPLVHLFRHEDFSAALLSSRSAHTEVIEAYSFSARSSTSYFAFPNHAFSDSVSRQIQEESEYPPSPAFSLALVSAAPVASASPVLSVNISSIRSSIIDMDEINFSVIAEEERVSPISFISTTLQGSFPSEVSESMTFSSSDMKTSESSHDSIDSPVSLSPEDKPLMSDTYFSPRNDATNTIVTLDELLSPAQSSVSTPFLQPEYGHMGIDFTRPYMYSSGLVAVHDFLAAAFILPTVSQIRSAQKDPIPQLVFPPPPLPVWNVVFDPFAPHKYMIVHDAAVRVHPHVPIYKIRPKEVPYRPLKNALDVCVRPPLPVYTSFNPEAVVRAEDYYALADCESLISSPRASEKDSLSNSGELSSGRNSLLSCMSSSSLRNDIMHILGQNEPISPPSTKGFRSFRMPLKHMTRPEIIRAQPRYDTAPYPAPPQYLHPSDANPHDQARYAAWLGVTGYQYFECQRLHVPDRGVVERITPQNLLPSVDERPTSA